MSTFDPLPWQIAPWRDTSKVLLLAGGAGGGKSRLALEKIHALATKYPHYSGFLCRKTRSSLTNSTLATFESSVIGGLSWVKHHKTHHYFEYPNGSKIFYFGMEDAKQREAIRGIGIDSRLDGGFVDEANSLLEQDHNELVARLRGVAGPFLQLIYGTNPDAPEHWIHKRLIQKKEATVYYSYAADNKYNPDTYQATLSMISGVQGKRLRDGIWERAEGAVIPEFDRFRHVITKDYVPRTWRRIRSIDFGYRHPFVCLWIAINPETDERYIYRELYQTELLVQDAAEIIKRTSGAEEIEVTVCDHDPENYGQLERYGISTIPAYKEVIPGINHLKTLFKNNKIYYCNDALIKQDINQLKKYLPTSVIEELPLYVYAKPTEADPNKEVPVKNNDDGVDALRYAMAYLDNIGEETYGSLQDVIGINAGGTPPSRGFFG